MLPDAAMYGFKHIQFFHLPALPSEVSEALSPNTLDVGRMYLAISLALLISFITYYAVTLSFELYRTIVSISIPISISISLLRSAKRGLPSSAQTHGPGSTEATPLHLEVIREISSASAPFGHLAIFQDNASTDEGSQVDSHGSAHGVTPESERPCTLEEGLVEDRTEEAVPSHRLMDNAQFLADVDCQCACPAEDVHHPQAEQEAPDSHVDDTDGSARPADSVPIPAITTVADTSGDTSALVSSQPSANDMPTLLADERQAVDDPVDASPSFLLLPALPATVGHEAGDDSLQPTAASVTRLSAIAHCADLRSDCIADELDASGGIAAAVQSDETNTNILTLDTRGLDTPSNVLSESTPEDIKVELDVHDPCEVATTTPLQILLPSCGEESTIGEAGADEATAGGALAHVSDCIMESVLLVDDLRGQQVISTSDAEPELDWTTVDREDCEVKQEPISQLIVTYAGPSNEPEAAQEQPESTHGVDTSVHLLTHSECVEPDTVEVVSSPVSCEVPSGIIEATSTPQTNSTSIATSTVSVNTCPEIERTLCLVLLDVASAQASAQSHVPHPNDSADVYVGPLPDKPPRVRAHTEQKPDWAVAPDPPKPTVAPEQPKSNAAPEQPKSKVAPNLPKPKPRLPSGSGKSTSGNVRCGMPGGSTRKVSAPTQQGAKPDGKDEKQKTAPSRAPESQKPKSASVPAKTRGGSGLIVAPARRRSARIT